MKVLAKENSATSQLLRIVDTVEHVQVFNDVGTVRRAAEQFFSSVLKEPDVPPDRLKVVQKAISDIGIMAGMQVRSDVLVGKCNAILSGSADPAVARLSGARLADEISAPVSGW